MGVSRYTIEENLAHYDPNGQWVLYEDHAPAMAAKDAEIAALRERSERLTAALNDLAIAHGRLLLEKARWVLSDKPATPKVADATPDVAAPQPATPGLRWGVRHTQGAVVAKFKDEDTATWFIRCGHTIGFWPPRELELIDLTPTPVETPAQPPTSAKSH